MAEEEKESFAQLIRQQGIVAFGDQPLVPPAPGAHQRLPESGGAATGRTRAMLPADHTDLECHDDSWHASGQQRAMQKAMRANCCQESIDLHGLKVDEAWSAVDEFLDRAQQQDQRVVEIVHGYGRTCNSPSVLRGKVRGWLAASDEVIWFCQPKRNKGITVVGLRSRRRR